MSIQSVTVEVRGLRCVIAGPGQELRPGEVLKVDANAADFLIQIDAAELVNPADASRVADAVRRQQEHITSRGFAETFRSR
jgi:hypothetical protein